MKSGFGTLMLDFRIYLDFLSLSIDVPFLVRDPTMDHCSCHVFYVSISSVTASQSFLVFHDLASFEEYCIGVL